jgi:aryl-alcohol dehydrogenase-like predicted oxidoreductase
MAREQVSRRTFLGDTVAVATGIAAAGALSAQDSSRARAQQKIRSYNEKMEYRRLGRTNLMVSAISLGSHWKRLATVLGPAFASDVDVYKTVSLNTGTARTVSPEFIKNRDEVVSACIEAGINFIDTCDIGEVKTYVRALQGRSDKVYMGFSTYWQEPRFEGWRTTEKLMQGFENGLREAKLDHVDLWRMSVRTDGSATPPAEVEAIFAALDKAKQQGKARFTGIGTHDYAWSKKMIETYPKQIEVLLVPYTAGSKELPKDSLFDTVRKYDVGVFGIKPFANASLFAGDSSPNSPTAEEDSRRARLAIRYILANPAITAPIPGLITVEQVKNMVRAIQERRELDLKEQADLEKAAQEMWARLPQDYQWLRKWEHV